MSKSVGPGNCFWGFGYSNSFCQDKISSSNLLYSSVKLGQIIREVRHKGNLLALPCILTWLRWETLGVVCGCYWWCCYYCNYYYYYCYAYLLILIYAATPYHDGMRTPLRDRAWNPYTPMSPLLGNWWLEVRRWWKEGGKAVPCDVKIKIIGGYKIISYPSILVLAKLVQVLVL